MRGFPIVYVFLVLFLSGCYQYIPRRDDGLAPEKQKIEKVPASAGESRHERDTDSVVPAAKRGLSNRDYPIRIDLTALRTPLVASEESNESVS